MAVAPFKLKRVFTNQFDLPDFQIVRNMDGQDDSNPRHLVFARGTWTETPQSGRQVMAFLAIGPDDHEFPGADLLDLCWRTFFHSISNAGSSKLRMLI